MYDSLLQQLIDTNIVTQRGINPKYKALLNSNLHLLKLLIDNTPFVTFHDNHIRERLYCVINNITQPVLCEYCHTTPTKFISNGKFRNTYSKFCSVKCSNNAASVKAKKQQTSLEHYGVPNPSQSVEVKKQKIATSLERYGCEYPWQHHDVKFLKTTQVQSKYGVDNIAKLDCVKKKKQQTNTKKYGYPNPAQNPLIQQKIKHTTLSTYNVEHYSQIHIPKQTLEKLNDSTWLYNQHYIKQTTLQTIASQLNVCDVTVGKYLHSHGFLTKRFPASIAEQQIVDFLKNHQITNILTNVRDVIPPRELDIFLPDYNIAIEYCGLYWHSHYFKPKNYHIDKLNECNKIGIRLITIFEDEWLYQRRIVEQKLLSILGKDNRDVVYARKCEIRLVPPDVKRQFFEENHIQGNGPGSINYGLFFQNNLVAVMSFIRLQNNQYVLNRYATSYRVIGGASKLLNYFKKSYQWSEIISFADRRWSDGKLYEKTGWKLDKILAPDYYYVVDSKRIHKFNYRRKRLPLLLENFDPNLSETQNTSRAGIPRIYNCGLLRYKIR